MKIWFWIFEYERTVMNHKIKPQLNPDLNENNENGGGAVSQANAGKQNVYGCFAIDIHTPYEIFDLKCFFLF